MADEKPVLGRYPATAEVNVEVTKLTIDTPKSTLASAKENQVQPKQVFGWAALIIVGLWLASGVLFHYGYVSKPPPVWFLDGQLHQVRSPELLQAQVTFNGAPGPAFAGKRLSPEEGAAFCAHIGHPGRHIPVGPGYEPINCTRN